MTQTDITCAEGQSNELISFKKITLWVMGAQVTIVMICLSMCVTIMSTQSANNEKLTEISTRQKDIAIKAERAREDALKALAASGRSESDIAWIREGLTELKLTIRETKFKGPQ